MKNFLKWLGTTTLLCIIEISVIITVFHVLVHNYPLISKEFLLDTGTSMIILLVFCLMALYPPLKYIKSVLALSLLIPITIFLSVYSWMLGFLFIGQGM